MYLANTTRPDIAFAVNLLARQGIVLLLLGDIGMGSNTFCDILKGQLIWAYFILLIVAQILLVMLMQDIYLIHTKLDPKQAMCLYVGGLLYLGDLQSSPS